VTPSSAATSRLICISLTESAYTPERNETARGAVPDGSAERGVAVTRPTVPSGVSAVKYLVESVITI
jgi:hypothetical protein